MGLFLFAIADSQIWQLINPGGIGECDRLRSFRTHQYRWDKNKT
jgi:hypothetical protein